MPRAKENFGQVLTTRPKHLAERLTLPLAAAGWQPTNLALLELKPLAIKPEHKNWLLNLDNFDALVVVSPSAVEILLEELSNYWPQWPLGITWYTVGAGSSKSLLQAGIESTYPSSGDTSEDLLALPELQNMTGKKVLLAKGEGGRDILYDTLSARGAQVSLLPLYQRQVPEFSAAELAQMFQPAYKALVITSAAALENYLQLAKKFFAANPSQLEQLLAQQTVLVPSARVERLAASLGFQRALSTQGAGAEAILASLNGLSK